MTRATRFRLWAADVAGLVIVPHAWFAGPVDSLSWQVAGAGIITLLLIGMAALMITTPPDAVRLRRWTSVIVLTLLTAALYGHAWFRFHGRTSDGMCDVFTVACAAALAVRAQPNGVTPWWVAPLFWNPLMAGPVALPAWVVGIVAMALFAVLSDLRFRTN